MDMDSNCIPAIITHACMDVGVGVISCLYVGEIIDIFEVDTDIAVMSAIAGAGIGVKMSRMEMNY